MVSSGFGICFIKSEIVCLLEGVGTTAQVIDNRCVHNTDFKTRYYVPTSLFRNKRFALNEIIQNLLYFMYKKIPCMWFFRLSFRATLLFSL